MGYAGHARAPQGRDAVVKEEQRWRRDVTECIKGARLCTLHCRRRYKRVERGVSFCSWAFHSSELVRGAGVNFLAKQRKRSG
eukprot:gene11514-biopygen9348